MKGQVIELEEVATGFQQPLNIQNAGDDRLFIVEQGGKIKILQPDGTIESTPFLDLSSAISTGGERGLLGLAFSPDYSNDGYFYVYYTNSGGDSQLSRFSVNTSDANQADASSETQLLNISQPFSNHNGGYIAFGSDGMLYVGTGDGGSGGDPNDNAQNLNVLLGKMLRLDVNSPAPYIPTDNPYASHTNAQDEIWARGLRNPWKFSFDSESGELWIGDVGQGEFEEINKTSNTGGLNFGWRCYEGNSVYDSSGNCPDDSELTFPLAEYSHNNDGLSKCSITGGYVYRGSEYPNLQGKYIFADYCSDEIGMVDATGTITYFGPFEGNNFSSFGIDNNQNLYVCGIQSGKIFKITDANLSVSMVRDKSIVLYPNPSDSLLHIQGKEPITKVFVYTLEGKKVGHQLYKGAQNKVTFKNFNRFAAGLYFIKVQNKSGNWQTGSVLKK